mmetsp:Transcript_106270/g.307745  ORF Transcript_106270/g.307745 Transcript_106270/m.307745 type:complete len:261 (-) Transcript_106270:11059-11841(-)
MALEDAGTRVVVYVARDRVGHVLEPVFEDDVALGRVERVVEDAEERVERGLVDAHDLREVGHGEVEDRAALGHGGVDSARLVDVVLDEVRLLELALDVHRLRLGLVERRDELLVVEDVALRVRQLAEQRVLQLHNQLGVLAHLCHERRKLLLEVGALVGDHNVEKLIGEAVHGNGVVDDHDLGHDLRRVMRVGELGGEEELEVVRPVNLLIAELDELLARLDRDLFLEDRVEHRVDVLTDVLKEEGVTVLNRELEVLHKV